jgi:hypothetical protein
MTRPNRTNAKIVSAVIGGGALVALGALTVAVGEQPTAPRPIAVSAGVPVASTSTTEPGAPAISMAVPGIKGPAPLPSEEQGPAAP